MCVCVCVFVCVCVCVCACALRCAARARTTCTHLNQTVQRPPPRESSVSQTKLINLGFYGREVVLGRSHDFSLAGKLSDISQIEKCSA